MNREFGVKQRKCVRCCIILVENELKCDVARLACSTTNQTALKQITLLQVLESSSTTPFCKNVLEPATS